MELDETQIQLRIDNFLREFEACQASECERFYRVSELCDLMQKRTGILPDEFLITESLTRLAFQPVQIEDEVLYPIRPVL